MERGHAIFELTEDTHDPDAPERVAGIALCLGVHGLLFLMQEGQPLGRGVMIKIGV